MEFEGLSRHNVVDQAFRLPVGRYTCIIGVSGAGKSTLLSAAHDVLLASKAGESKVVGGDALHWVRFVTQAPIGKNSRSNLATYTKLFDRIRRVFAGSPGAIAAGLDESAFSFNVGSGRCESCEGHGVLHIDMHYLPAITTTCRDCGGRRFKPQILEVEVGGQNIADLLDLTVDEARTSPVFQDSELRRVLACLEQVGLGYLTLGQGAPTLSGGECQRLKLARLLAKAPRKGRGLVVLDEPLVGLHPIDAGRIVAVIEALVDAGHTVLVADHQRVAVAEADWVVEVGPEAGTRGGRVLAQYAPSSR